MTRPPDSLPWPPWPLPCGLASLVLLGLLLVLGQAPGAMAWKDLDPFTAQYKSWVDDTASGNPIAQVEHLYRCKCPQRLLAAALLHPWSACHAVAQPVDPASWLSSCSRICTSGWSKISE